MISGGTQIQTITLQQSGGIPSNRISSVNNGGSFNYNYSYDNAGNVTNDGLHTYIYDAENRLVSVDNGATAQYTYDYKNRRTVKTLGSSITRYVWDDWQVIAEYDGSTGNLSTEYVYSGNRMIARFDGGTTRYYLNDRLSERVVLDANGALVGRLGHLPYGEAFGTSGEQENHRFTSYERDSETGMDYAINRYYSYSVGRFAENDPVLDLGFKTARGGKCGDGQGSEYVQPQNLSRYNYTMNDPISHVDPQGLNLENPCTSPEIPFHCPPEFASCEFDRCGNPIENPQSGGGGDIIIPVPKSCLDCEQRERKKCNDQLAACNKQANKNFRETDMNVCSKIADDLERRKCRKGARLLLRAAKVICDQTFQLCNIDVRGKCNKPCGRK